MLTRRTAETLKDLIENRLASMAVCDNEDAREVATLKFCLSEIEGIAANMTSPSAMASRRGRKPKVANLSF